MIPSWVDRYIGIPFRDCGHDPVTGFSCYGLLRAVFAQQAGIEMPAYNELSIEDAARADAQMMGDLVAGPWSEVQTPFKLMDIVLMKGVPMHCGVLVSPTHVLHVWKATHSVLMPLDHPRIRHRIIGIYRHRDVA